MTRWLLILVLAAGCAMPAALADMGPPLQQSNEPFILNPRFCGGIGNACAVQPTPC